jgi:hypothetical protein
MELKKKKKKEERKNRKIMRADSLPVFSLSRFI